MKIQNKPRSNPAVLIAGTVVQFGADGIAEVDDAIGAKLLAVGYRRYEPPAARRSTGSPQPVQQAVQSAPAEPESARQESAAEDGGLGSLSAAQLKKLAKERGIDTPAGAKKADIIAAIENVAQAEQN